MTKLDSIEKIINLLSSSSYTKLDSIRYDLKDREAAKLEVYKVATKNAVLKARAIVSEIENVRAR